MARLYLCRGLFLLGCTSIVLGTAYGGWIAYLVRRERVAPSTQQVLLLKDGRTVPLTPPTPVPVSRTTSAAITAPLPENGPSSPPIADTAPALPPVRIVIPTIDADWPVVLSANDQLPRFRGVGWLLGSAYPGQSGNLVLFGHLAGRYGTFMRLRELRPGDQFRVLTDTGEYRYRVRTSYDTTPEDVAVLAPGDGTTATLITCSGPWNVATQTNERRLIVLADAMP